MQISVAKPIVRLMCLGAAFLLAACGSQKTSSYLPSKNVVNVEADVAQVVAFQPEDAAIQLANRTVQPQALQYRLFWYDAQGVTQQGSEVQPWQAVLLAAEQQLTLPLAKPNEAAQFYRFYLRLAR